MENFKKGTKLQLRFKTKKGEISIEDLWGLSLESLDVIAKDVNKELKDSSEESFIGKKTAANKTLQLKLDIIKEVIKDKMDAKERLQENAIKRTKIAKLKELAERKSDQELEGKTKEEIDEMVKSLTSSFDEEVEEE